jgi:hypothetical protein
MTQYTKQQIENNMLNAGDLLMSWSSGQGAPAKSPDTFNESSDDTVKGVTVTTAQAIALARLYAVNKSQSFVTALAQGYLSANHQSQYVNNDSKKTSTPSTPVKPLVGHYKTAADFEQDSIEEFCNIVHAYNLLSRVTDSWTKKDILAVIAEAFELPQARREAIAEAYRKEYAVQAAQNELYPYLHDIKTVSDKQLSGKIRAELGAAERLVLNDILKGYQVDLIFNAPPKMDGIFEVDAGYTELFLTIKETV